jgi:hypothetical protein
MRAAIPPFCEPLLPLQDALAVAGGQKRIVPRPLGELGNEHFEEQHAGNMDGEGDAVFSGAVSLAALEVLQGRQEHFSRVAHLQEAIGESGLMGGLV